MTTASESLERKLGRPPGELELATEACMQPRDVATVRQATAKTVSLSAPTGADGKELVDVVADLDIDTAEEATGALLRQEIEQLLGSLSPAAARVLKLRFGIGTGQARTTNDVATMLSISPERVRQIEARALSTLRHRITPMFWAS